MKKIGKYLLLFLAIILGNLSVFAIEPNQCDRNTLENYGVNKKWNITTTNKSNVMNTPCVDASEKIYDFSNVLTQEEQDELKKAMDEYIKKTNMDIVIVIDNIAYSYDYKNEEYAADFYDYNDFGMMNDEYSGTLLLRNTYEQDPYYNIYTFGKAQLYYDYDRLEHILDVIYDDLHSGNYIDGFNRYIDYLEDYYDRGVAIKDKELDENGYLVDKYVYPWLGALIISGITTLVIILILVKKNKMVKKATQAAEYMDKETAKITKREDTFITSHTTSYTTSSSSGSSGGGGGGHSSGGSSGGGHSSGGGRHG